MTTNAFPDKGEPQRAEPAIWPPIVTPLPREEPAQPREAPPAQPIEEPVKI